MPKVKATPSLLLNTISFSCLNVSAKIHIPTIPPKKLPYIAIREKTKKHDCYERYEDSGKYFK